MSKSVKEIRSTIKSIAGRTGNLYRDIQLCLLDCVEHAVEHNDTSLIADLRTALGPIVVKRFERYVVHFVPVSFKGDTCRHDKKRMENGESLADSFEALQVAPAWNEWEAGKKAVKVKDLDALREFLAKASESEAWNEQAQMMALHLVGQLDDLKIKAMYKMAELANAA